MDFQKLASEHRWILVIALGISIFVFAFSPAEPLLYDSALYVDIGKNLLGSLCFCSNFEPAPTTAPVLPVLIALSMLAFGSLFIKALLAGIAFFGVLASYHFVLRISNMRTAQISSILLFLTPLFISNSMLLLQDLLFAALIILSMSAYLDFLERKKPRNTIILALMTSLAVMTKMFGYVLIPIFLVHFLLARKRHKIPFRSLALMLLLVAAFLAPWSVWRYSLGLNEANVGDLYFFGGNYGHVLLRIESFYGSGEPMNANPIAVDFNVPFQAVSIARMLASILIYISPVVSLYFAFKLVKYKKSFRGRYDSLLLIWLFAFLAFFVFGFFYFGSRYLMAAALPMIIFFARFIDANLSRKRLLVMAILAVHLLSVAAITYMDFQLVRSKSQTGIFAESGVWLRDNTDPGSNILAFGAPLGAIAYYSERKVVGMDTLPDYVIASDFEGPKDIAAYQKEKNITLEKIKEFSDRRYYAEIYRRVA
jgi:4-amino-4-deoxy-L-arabinose transferase-like glycosyltransferase